MKKEILVAIDGSAYSSQALSYIIMLFREEENTHFHLCSWITPETSIMPSLADSQNSLIPNSGQNKKSDQARRYLDRALEKMTVAGVAAERIRTSIEISGFNIAATIQQHAANELPDALLLGRRGLNGISEMVMGSVSATIFRRCHSTPLWIIDGEIQHKNILVSVDGTPASLLALDHLAHIMGGRKDIHIYLFHCSALLGKKVQCDPQLYYEQWDKEWCDQHLSGNNCLFQGPRQILLQAGIPDAKIEILPERTDLDEAHGIIREAKRQNCGTIVIGRRGGGIAKGLFGGVSDRTIKRVQNLALWVVG